ncbi:CynX/NimT family MFS transporter [Ellagibacter isourolithinifaciens]|uniref:MFS transporter n=2 Tax=Ellagibacter isourolithinifaciens TaxID=2137581 RepID=UPI003AB0BFEA
MGEQKGRVASSVRASDSRKPRQLGYVALSIVLLAVGVSVCIVQYKVPSILDPIMGSYGMSTDSGAWLMSIFTMVGIFLSLPASGLAKRIGPKKLLLLACAVIVVGGVMGAFAGSTWQMIMSRGIEGVAFVFVTVAGPLVIERYVDRTHQGTANGIWSLWICLGSVIGSTATPVVYGAVGLKGTWLVYAGIVIAAAVVMAVFIRGNGDASADDEASGDAVREAQLGDYLRFLKPQALLFFFAYLVFNVEILAVLSYTPTFLQQQGMNATLSGFASSLPGLLAIVSSLAYGKLIDKTGRTKIFYLLALVVSAPATMLMLTQSEPLLWVGAAGVGLVGYAIPVACLTALPQIAGSKEMMPAAMGVFTLVQCLGEFLGSLVTPMLLGPAMDQWTFCGMAMLVFGLTGALAMAVCKIK